MASDELEAMLESFRAELRRRIARRLPPALAASLDDVVQEASIRLWKALAGERKIASVPSYLHKVAANATIDALREHRARREEALAPESGRGERAGAREPVDARSDPERDLARRELAARLEAALGTLRPERRRAARLHLQGFTTQEIAELCGWSEPKARNLAYRALDELRAQLAQEER